MSPENVQNICICISIDGSVLLSMANSPTNYLCYGLLFSPSMVIGPLMVMLKLSKKINKFSPWQDFQFSIFSNSKIFHEYLLQQLKCVYTMSVNHIGFSICLLDLLTTMETYYCSLTFSTSMLPIPMSPSITNLFLSCFFKVGVSNSTYLGALLWLLLPWVISSWFFQYGGLVKGHSSVIDYLLSIDIKGCVCVCIYIYPFNTYAKT